MYIFNCRMGHFKSHDLLYESDVFWMALFVKCTNKLFKSDKPSLSYWATEQEQEQKTEHQKNTTTPNECLWTHSHGTTTSAVVRTCCETTKSTPMHPCFQWCIRSDQHVQTHVKFTPTHQQRRFNVPLCHVGIRLRLVRLPFVILFPITDLWQAIKQKYTFIKQYKH